MPTVSDIVALMDALAPPRLAEEWDNPGLQVGSPQWPVKKVMVALDPSPAVIAEACEQAVDLLITHHPFLFKAIKQLDYSTPLGRMIEMATRHHLAVFAAHTNLDWVAGGLNDVFAAAIGLKNVSILASPELGEDNQSGLGRIGDMDAPMDLASLAGSIKRALGLESIWVAGAGDMRVRRVAVCTGSGSGLLQAFFNSDAQVFVTGDLRYHDGRDAELYQRGLIDTGHFSSEHLMVDSICSRLASALAASGWDTDVIASKREAAPFIRF